jgi:hypothetical protein
VFVHGLLVNANLWREVVPKLSPDFRCIALDLPLGSHELPMRESADLSPRGMANLIADATEARPMAGRVRTGSARREPECNHVPIKRRAARRSELSANTCMTKVFNVERVRARTQPAASP